MIKSTLIPRLSTNHNNTSQSINPSKPTNLQTMNINHIKWNITMVRLICHLPPMYHLAINRKKFLTSPLISIKNMTSTSQKEALRAVKLLKIIIKVLEDNFYRLENQAIISIKITPNGIDKIRKIIMNLHP